MHKLYCKNIPDERIAIIQTCLYLLNCHNKFQYQCSKHLLNREAKIELE